MDAYSHRIQVGRRFGARIAAGDAVFLTGSDGAGGLPCTVRDGLHRPFGGMNRMMLLQVMKDQGWSDPRFFTTAQVEEAGWTVGREAKHISLQFLVSSGDDDLPLERPTAKLFQVFNAGDIAGVPALPPGVQVPIEFLREAVTRAGFQGEAADLKESVFAWIASLQGAATVEDSAGAALRAKLTAALLEVQAGTPLARAEPHELSSEWAEAIDLDPLSFFQAVRDADLLSATVMGHINAVRNEVETAQELVLAQEAREKDMGVGMSGKNAASPHVEAMFQERAAVLAVPFREKDKAREKGAVWYGPQSLWFVPKGISVERFKEWDPRAHVLGVTATEEVLISDFRQAMTEMGLDTSGPILADGMWHNVSVDTKPGRNKAGAYICSLTGGRNGEPTGMINDKYTGASRPWRYEGALLTPEQRARLRAQSLEREAVATLEVVKAQNAAAAHASEIFDAGVSAESHLYVLKKGMRSEGMRQVPGSLLLEYPEYRTDSGASIIRPTESYLIVPMRDATGQLRAVQAISEDGSVKSFMRGAQKKGTMFVLGSESFNSLCKMSHVKAVGYCEGVATGASFRKGTDIPVIVCFDANNLETVAAETGGKLPMTMLPVLAVDNDQFHIESAAGFLSKNVGTNPHAVAGQVVTVASGSAGKRSICLGEAIADGQWHQAPLGKYCVTLQREENSDAIRSAVVEVVPDNGARKVSATFVNRGLEAGRKATRAFAGPDGASRAVTVVPEFKSAAGRPTDWNDLEKIEGIEAVRALVLPVLSFRTLPQPEVVPAHANAAGFPMPAISR